MSNLQGKRLLFLGGAVQCCKVVEAAKRLGVYTIVTDINASRPMREIADEILPYSVKDVDGIADWCTKNHVDGIMNLCIDAAQKVQEQRIRDPKQCRELLMDSIKAQMNVGDADYAFENQKSVVLVVGVVSAMVML